MRALAIFCLLAVAAPAFGHQPVMDMAPRWSSGFGFQLRHEHYGSDDLMQGRDRIANPFGVARYVDTTWLEGVYTIDRSIRATVKLPYVNQRRVTLVNGSSVHQQNSGIGDLVLGLPLKRYKNKGAMTANWGLTPSIRVPTGSSSGDMPISDGSWDVGISASYSRETPGTYALYDLYYWHEGSGDRGMQTGNSWGLDVNVGVHPWHDNDDNTGLFVMWDVSARHNDAPNAQNLTTASAADRVQTGPVLVYYRGSFMARAEAKFIAYERLSGISLSKGSEFSLAFGVVF